ncbi:flagellar hook capping protein [Marinicauda salina]|uniref:Basal-body rod modification protein FlgD n=1 Tax=Marinicauda salina TaxID=2135793 RepID=A0A2U2BRZ2_9PROT|nr:flagellar hook assembly protein FlgD [Marinicauda salina]PWE16766.1 flagellar hook capping protein [Marinicauda salina]
MVEFNPLAQALPQSGAAGQAGNASAELADNFDTFLTLLTEQLKNQDPLSPMDSKEFVGQLVQFSSVEQQINSNESLESLLALQSATARMSAVDYIGKTATVSGADARLSQGEAQWEYGLPREANRTQLLIKNPQGRLVATLEGETGAGPHTLSWDGRDNAGNVQPDGVYTLEVVAKDSEDALMETPIRISDRVTGVDMSGEDVMVEMGALRVPATQIIAVRQDDPAA